MLVLCCLQALPKPVPTHVTSQLQRLSPAVISWFEQQRGISRAVLQRNMVRMVIRPASGLSIAFPYFLGRDVVNVKYRTLDKKFSQVKGGSQVFYGMNDLQVRPRATGRKQRTTGSCIQRQVPGLSSTAAGGCSWPGAQHGNVLDMPHSGCTHALWPAAILQPSDLLLC